MLRTSFCKRVLTTIDTDNFERRYLGEITVEEALAQSINTAAVRLLLQAGGPRVVARLASRRSISCCCSQHFLAPINRRGWAVLVALWPRTVS